MSAELWAAFIAILGIIAETLRRAWKLSDERRHSKDLERQAANNRRRRAIDRRDAGGLFNP